MSNNQLILQPDKYAYYRRHASSLPYPGQGSTAGALPNNGIQEAIYTSPVSTASKESDVAVPFYITLGSWALTFLLVICALWTASFFFEMTWSFWQYISVCALFSTIVSVIVWAWVIGDSRSLLRAEERLKMDINGRDDGNLSPPPAVDPVTIHVDIVDHMSKTSKTIHSRINIKREQLLEFAKRALLGRPLGVNANCGRGQPFSQNEYIDLLELMTRSKIIHSDAPNQPKQLTDAGRESLENTVKRLDNEWYKMYMDTKKKREKL